VIVDFLGAENVASKRILSIARNKLWAKIIKSIGRFPILTEGRVLLKCLDDQ